jgi:hypothetical protein
MSNQKEPTKDWRSAHEGNPWLFPLPSELLDDHSHVGVILRKLPVELIRDASRCRQPWTELESNQWIRQRDSGGCFSEFFAAIGSVLPASQSVVHLLLGVAKPIRKLRSGVSDSEEELRLQQRLFNAMYRLNREKLGRGLELESADVQELYREMEERLLAQMQKRGGPKTDEATNERDSIERSLPIQHMFSLRWIRFGPVGDGLLGDPGLCFYSDKAISALLGLLGFHHSSPEDQLDRVRHLRFRIGLKQANKKDPYVTGARRCEKTGWILLNLSPARPGQTSEDEWIPLRSAVKINGVIRYQGVPRSTEPGGGSTR